LPNFQAPPYYTPLLPSAPPHIQHYPVPERYPQPSSSLPRTDQQVEHDAALARLLFEGEKQTIESQERAKIELERADEEFARRLVIEEKNQIVNTEKKP